MRTGPRPAPDIARIARGTGPRQVLLVHCTLASARSLVPVMDALDGSALTMTAFDLPGHGRSGDWTGNGDYLSVAAEVAEGFCAGPVDLVGHSFGAVVALALMVRRPELVRSAVLVEPVLFAAAEAGSGAQGRHAAAHDAIRAALAAGDREGAARRFTGIWGTGPAWAEIPAAQRRAMRDRIHLVEASRPGLSEDSTGILAPGRLDRVGAPVLLLRGADSPPIVPEILATLRARLPRAREEVVAGAGHMVPLTHPERVAALIGAHLSRAR